MMMSWKPKNIYQLPSISSSILFTEGRNAIIVRVWSVTSDGARMRSEEPLVHEVGGAPRYMRDYARKLEQIMPKEAITSQYLFKLELMKQVAKDLRGIRNVIFKHCND
jgi:hypothetical protein